METVRAGWESALDTAPLASVIFGSYLTFLVLGSWLLPGRRETGVEIGKKKKRLEYKFNGLLLHVVSMGSFLVGSILGWIPGTIIYDNFAGLLLVVNCFAFSQVLFLYFKGKYFSREPAEFGLPLENQGLLMDLWMGVEVNPRLFGLDLKFFAYRPSMTGWTLVNASFAFVQYQQTGTLSAAMILYQVLTNLYVLDYFYNEPKMITTWDIIAERFGFMLVWGDYVFIPFYFSLQCWVLIDMDGDLSPAYVAANLAVFLLGFYIFRSANSQKHTFKESLKSKKEILIWGKKPQVITTETGSQLLISGFWGIARKMNYTGDLLMAISYCMPTGLHSVLGWAYFAYLFTLLVHRAHRDNMHCAQKYKESWKEYCKKVPYTLIPYIY